MSSEGLALQTIHATTTKYIQVKDKVTHKSKIQPASNERHGKITDDRETRRLHLSIVLWFMYECKVQTFGELSLCWHQRPLQLPLTISIINETLDMYPTQ